MANPMQAFVRGQDGNLWLETGPWGDSPPMSASRLQVDSSVGALFDQVGGNRIWRPAFQPLSPDAIFVLGGDGNLWLEVAPFGDVGTVVRNRLQVDANVAQFWATDTNTVFVLGTDGNLWFEVAPFGDVDTVVRNRQQVDGSVSAFQVMDTQTLFVLGTDGNLWLETGPWGNVAAMIGHRLQVDGSVMQFWANDVGTCFVLGEDLNLWFERAPWGDVGLVRASRLQIDANANDLQPIDENTVFVLGHDGNLWLEPGPYVDVAHTIAARSFVAGDVLAFGALDSAERLYYVDADSNLWYLEHPFGPVNRQIVDSSVNGCFPLYSRPSLFGC